MIDARDGTKDFSIQCGRGSPAKPGRPVRGIAAGRALTDPFNPGPSLCSITKHGRPVDGLGAADEDEPG